MKLSSNDVRDRTFAIVRKGYDPAAVDTFLDEVGIALDEAYDALDSLPRINEATQEAASPLDESTGMRDDLLDEARDEIGRIQRTAATAAERLVRAAEDESQSVLIDARRDALALMQRSRAEADALVIEARLEQAELEERLAELRHVVQRTEHLLKGMASGALGDVAKASTMLATIERMGGGKLTEGALHVEVDDSEQMPPGAEDDFNVDVQPSATDEGEASELPASVDRLLEQLRDIS